MKKLIGIPAILSTVALGTGFKIMWIGLYHERGIGEPPSLYGSAKVVNIMSVLAVYRS
jgi:hypothetical protein